MVFFRLRQNRAEETTQYILEFSVLFHLELNLRCMDLIRVIFSLLKLLKVYTSFEISLS